MSFVYFVQCANSKLIKIGKTGSLRSRLSTLKVQAGEPIQFLCAIAEDSKINERKIQDTFIASRAVHPHDPYCTEWFNPTDNLLAYIDTITTRAKLGLDATAIIDEQVFENQLPYMRRQQINISLNPSNPAHKLIIEQLSQSPRPRAETILSIVEAYYSGTKSTE